LNRVLADNPIGFAYAERRKQSYEELEKWATGVLVFLQDHLAVMEHLGLQLDLRRNIGKHSHGLMIKYFKDRVTQLA
jgi:hypothetical protein